MALERTSKAPVNVSGDVHVQVTDGERYFVVHISQEALNDADRAIHDDATRLTAIEDHWSEIQEIAERKHLAGQFDLNRNILITAADLEGDGPSTP